jgi:peptidyl-prolyl cis-trans isomerase C
MKKQSAFLLLVVMAFTVTGCSKPTPTIAPTQTPIQVTVEPSPTTVPLALNVNGEGISLSEYNAELSRLQLALAEIGEEMTPEQQKERITNNFIDELLLSQAATQVGFAVSDENIQQRIDTLTADIGGQDKFIEWQTKYGYTPESFREALKRSVLVTWQRDQILESVPLTTDQVHARQLLFQDQDNANEALRQIRSGVDFATLAEAQDPTLGGDLGWFPQGTLTQPEVEAAVFALQPGETSEVIKSSIGYHIINLIERDAAHTLSIEARRKLQELKLEEWLKASRESSSIEILLP